MNFITFSSFQHICTWREKRCTNTYTQWIRWKTTLISGKLVLYVIESENERVYYHKGDGKLWNFRVFHVEMLSHNQRENSLLLQIEIFLYSVVSSEQSIPFSQFGICPRTDIILNWTKFIFILAVVSLFLFFFWQLVI